MKRLYSLMVMIGTILLLSGCTNNNETELQTQIIDQNNKIIELQEKLKEEAKPIEQDNLFQKKQDCLKYEESIKDEYPLASVNIFYSSNQQTCVSELIRIENGNISNKSLSDVLSNKVFAHLSKNNELIYDEKEFGLGQTYNTIKAILQGE